MAGFRKLNSGPKVVIATGNILPWLPPTKKFFAIYIQKKIIATLVEDFVSRYDKTAQHSSKNTPQAKPSEPSANKRLLALSGSSPVCPSPVSVGRGPEPVGEWSWQNAVHDSRSGSR